jgi:hypothetical protein
VGAKKPRERGLTRGLTCVPPLAGDGRSSSRKQHGHRIVPTRNCVEGTIAAGSRFARIGGGQPSNRQAEVWVWILVFSALERAFQLARSGKMAAVGDLEKQLEREGLRPESRAWRTLAEGAIEKAHPRGAGAKGRPECCPRALIVALGDVAACGGRGVNQLLRIHANISINCVAFSHPLL